MTDPIRNPAGRKNTEVKSWPSKVSFISSIARYLLMLGGAAVGLAYGWYLGLGIIISAWGADYIAKGIVALWATKLKFFNRWYEGAGAKRICFAFIAIGAIAFVLGVVFIFGHFTGVHPSIPGLEK